MLYLLCWHSLARRFSVTIPRRKETRKTNLALVDFVIYAVFSHVVRISANRSETNIRCAARPGESSCHSLFFAHSLEPFRVLGWRCRGDPFYARHVAVTEISHPRRRAHRRQPGFWKLLFRAVREQWDLLVLRLA